MGQVLIRNLDDEIVADYRRAAKANARSLEAELRETLAKARPRMRPSAEELTALAESLWAATPASAAAVDSTPYLRAMRDAR